MIVRQAGVVQHLYSGLAGRIPKPTAGETSTIAQTFLTEQELKALPLFLHQLTRDPTSAPSEGVIALFLAKYGRRHLRKRTLHLLEETSNRDELRPALIERIVDELRSWDGTADLTSEDGTQVYGLLRLCCQLDSFAGRANRSGRGQHTVQVSV